MLFDPYEYVLTECEDRKDEILVNPLACREFYSFPFSAIFNFVRKLIFLLLIPLFLFTSCERKEVIDEDRIVITALDFPSYDIARSVVKDKADLVMILPPGSSVHSYELTSSDVIKILSSDVFIFTGGESQSYISELLKNNDFDACVFSLLDNAPVKLKEESEGIINVHEEEASYDEHVWTSLENEKALVSSFSSLLASIDEDNASFYAENAREYNNEIEKLEEEIRDLVSSSLRKEIVVADRFPLLYFFTEFGLSWYAAYPGCAEETEVNAKTVSLLIDIIRERNIPFVVHMELSSQLLSDAISEETGCSVLTFNSVHTISKEDFEAGETYISLMRRNIETLKEALN